MASRKHPSFGGTTPALSICSLRRNMPYILAFLLAIFTAPLMATSAKADAMDDCNQNGNIARSIKGCTRVLKRYRLNRRNRAIVYYNRGNAYRRKQQWKRAIADYTRSLRLNSKEANSYYNRGVSYGNNGQADRAIADYSRAIRLKPSFVSAYINRANHYIDKGQFKRAIADTTKALRYKPNSPSAYNNRGIAYNNIGQHDRAIADYTKALEYRPNHANTFNNRGVVYRDKGQYDQAIAEYNEAIRLDPEYANPYFNRAIANKHNGKIIRAIVDFDRAIKLDPKGYTIFYISRGNAYAKADRDDLAHDDYRYALKLLRSKMAKKPTIKHRKLMAKVQLKLKQPEKGLVHALIVVETKPEDFSAWDTLGEIHEAMGHKDSAIKAYQKALSLDPNHKRSRKDLVRLGVKPTLVSTVNKPSNFSTHSKTTKQASRRTKKKDIYSRCSNDGNPDMRITACSRLLKRRRMSHYNRSVTYNARGTAFSDKGDEKRAIKDYSQAIRLTPKDTAAYVNRGNSYNALGQNKRALKDFNRAIRLNPKHVDAYIGRGSVYGDLEQFDRSLVSYNKAIRLDPQNANAFLNRGKTFFGKDQYDRAIGDFTKALRLDPELDKAYFNRAGAYFNKEEFDKAIADFSERLKRTPDDALAYKMRAYSYANKNQYNKTISDLTQVLELSPEDVEAYVSRGQAYSEIGKTGKALADFNKALKRSPKNAEAYYDRGIVYAEIGEYDRAIADYNRAISINAKDPDDYIARGNAYRHKGQYNNAIADYSKAIRLDPKSSKNSKTYYYRAVSYQKNGNKSRASKDLKRARALGANLEKMAATEKANGPDQPQKPLDLKSLKTKKMIGLTLAYLNDALRARYKLKDKVSGLVILAIDPKRAAAASKKVATGDVIIAVNGHQIGSMADLASTIDKMRKAGRHAFLVQVESSKGDTRYVALRLN